MAVAFTSRQRRMLVAAALAVYKNGRMMRARHKAERKLLAKRHALSRRRRLFLLAAAKMQGPASRHSPGRRPMAQLHGRRLPIPRRRPGVQGELPVLAGDARAPHQAHGEDTARPGAANGPAPRASSHGDRAPAPRHSDTSVQGGRMLVQHRPGRASQAPRRRVLRRQARQRCAAGSACSRTR